MTTINKFKTFIVMKTMNKINRTQTIMILFQAVKNISSIGQFQKCIRQIKIISCQHFVSGIDVDLIIQKILSEYQGVWNLTDQ